jgi:Leucine-rich repeat (LRR) protein
VGFSIGRYTDFLKPAPEGSVGVAFEEPMIEQAVKLQLGKAADDTITEEELLSVTGLYLFGDSLIAENEEDMHAAAKLLFESNQIKEGPIRSLADLSKIPNLKQIFICMQQITDVSPLAALQNLEVVDIKNNPVTDISPLGELKFLKRVTLFDTRVTDLSPLANCAMLSELDAGKLPIRSPAAFDGLNGLQNLSLCETTLDTLAGVEGLTQLKFIEVTGVIDGDLAPLLSLPYLENVVLGEDMKTAAEAIEAQANFTITFRQE